MGLGPELVTNGHFNVDTTGWSALNGGVLSSEAGGIDSSMPLRSSVVRPMPDLLIKR